MRPEVAQGYKKISVINFSAFPVEVMVTDYDRNQTVREVLTPENNSLILDRDISSTFAVGFKTPATGNSYFVPTS